MAYLGVDVARWQPVTLPWPAWVAAGLQVTVVQVTHGATPEPHAAEHLAGATAAGVPCIGAYHWLTPGNATGQAQKFLEAFDVEYQFAALDVEQDGIAAAEVVQWINWYGHGEFRPLVLYGNNSLAAIVAAHPELRRYKVWYAAYPAFPNPCADAPLAEPRNVPSSLAGRVAGWQYAGNNGVWPPYNGAIDRTIWYELPTGQEPMTVPISIPGCLIGGGAESGSDIIPIYTDLAAAGAVPPIIIGVHNPGLCVDAKRLGVQTTIARFMHPETGDDHDFEAGGAGRAGWSQDKRLRFARASIAMAFDHMNPTEAAATDFVQCSGNEWDAQDVGEWLATCDVWQLVLDERDNRQAEYVRKNGKPLKLAMGIFNAGTPKTWPMYQAIFSHPVFGRMHDNQDFIGFHEGMGFGQPKDYLANMAIEGGPTIPDAGLMNFRSDNALYVLASHGWECPYGYLELYDGWTRDAPDDPRIEFLIWVDSHMGTLGPATRKWFRGACAFELTNNPGSSWYRQDFTHVFEDPKWKAYAVSQIGRINGVTTMPNVSDSDFAALVAANNQQSAILAKYRAAVKHTLADKSNQYVINLFAHVLPNGLDNLRALGLLEGLAADRQALYTGPALEDMKLTAGQIDALVAALA